MIIDIVEEKDEDEDENEDGEDWDDDDDEDEDDDADIDQYWSLFAIIHAFIFKPATPDTGWVIE